VDAVLGAVETSEQDEIDVFLSTLEAVLWKYLTKRDSTSPRLSRTSSMLRAAEEIVAGSAESERCSSLVSSRLCERHVFMGTSSFAGEETSVAVLRSGSSSRTAEVRSRFT
jgi:hypothetical protein